MTKAEQEQALKRYLKTKLEELGLFVKFAQDGTCTVLKGDVGDSKEILVTGMPLMEAGQYFKLWGEDNHRRNRWQRLNPTKSPDGSGLPTPFSIASIEYAKTKNHNDAQEDSNDMSNKPSAARMRAKQTIREFQERQNGGDGGYTTAREDRRSTPRQRFAEHMEQQLSHTPADAARDAMIRRQAERPEQPRETYLQSIARKRWDTDCPTGRVIIEED